ncbi:glutamate receptor 2.9-like [Neltuma alba]|uniref:glutamate receptor 2.9-like n=1 Tax=Neltuma alba TaxID=207710 RepID=UPI0010A363D8|nr:glutamate receptor 2.9-like [Prosopis alba]
MMISCVVLLIAPTGAGDDDGGKKLIIGLPYYKSGFAQFVDVQIDPTNNNNQVVQASGYSIAVFNATIAYLTRLHHGISFEFRAFVNNNGSSAGYYDALVSQISAEKYDAVVGDVTILENRFNHADFTLPYTQSNVKMLVKIRHDPRLNMWIFVRPFNWSLWKKFSGVSILWLPVVQAVFPERESLAKNCSRFVLVMWLILVFVLMQSYTACLSSILTVHQLQPRYLSENDVAEDSNINVGYHSGSFVRDLLVDNLMINSSR